MKKSNSGYSLPCLKAKFISQFHNELMEDQKILYSFEDFHRIFSGESIVGSVQWFGSKPELYNSILSFGEEHGGGFDPYQVAGIICNFQISSQIII